jgi:hypothetical protein
MGEEEEIQEETHLEVAEVAEVAEEAEEHWLLRSPHPRLKQLSPRQLTSELWEPPQEYSKEIEQRQKISSMNSNITTVSIEGLLDSILL